MKKILYFVLTAILTVSCYDDSELRETVNRHEERLNELWALCQTLNDDIEALSLVVQAVNDADYITDIEPILEDSKIVGYKITFAKHGTVTIHVGADGNDGENGKDGVAPVIGVAVDETDGVYYWTLDGEWLLDGAGNKVKAVGSDGTSGTNGSNGTDGEDGVTPKLKIDEGYWWVSYDEGQIWEKLDKAVAENEPSESSCLFAEVYQQDGKVYFVLSDGQIHIVPLMEDGVKSYYLDEISKTRASLYSLMSEPCIVFPLITDIHYKAETSMRPELIDDTMNNMIELSKDIRFDCMIAMGDFTQGNKAMDETKAEARHVYEQFGRLGVPFYPCIGNHDTNIYYKLDGSYQKDHVFTLSQQYYIYMRDICDVEYDMPSCGTNYYKDFPEFNTRFVFLNSNDGDDYGYTDETLAWFKEVMNSSLDTYVFSHRKCSATSEYHNEAAMAEVITGSDNFKMYFYGHVHYDCEFAAPFIHESTQYLAFAQNAHKCYNHELKDTSPSEAVIPVRTVDTVDEDCFDVVVIRPYSQKVNLVRFGAGVDREFNLKTDRSVGESVMSTLPDEVTLELDFAAGWPFSEQPVAKENQSKNGEVYTYTYTYDNEGVTRYWDVDFVISRDEIDGFEYSYADGCLFFNNAGLTNSSNSYGLVAIPYFSGRYLSEISVTNGSAKTKRFNVRKGFTTTAAKKDYTAAVSVDAGQSYTYDFPLTASNGTTTICPGLGSSSSGLRDYALRMRDKDTKISKIVFTYTKTQPE